MGCELLLSCNVLQSCSLLKDWIYVQISTAYTMSVFHVEVMSVHQLPDVVILCSAPTVWASSELRWLSEICGDLHTPQHSHSSRTCPDSLLPHMCAVFDFRAFSHLPRWSAARLWCLPRFRETITYAHIKDETITDADEFSKQGKHGEISEWNPERPVMG